jgi:hypothetical protein
MAKTVDRPKCGSGAATTVIMPPGAIPAEPELEGPAKAPLRRVLGMQVEVLPSKYDLKAEKPFPFRSKEEYEDLEKKPVRNILSRVLGNGAVKLVGLGTLIAAPFVQIFLNDKIDGSLYTYFSQQAENLSKVFNGIYEYSSGIFLGFAAAVFAVGLSIPFVSNQPREDEIERTEHKERDEEAQKAHKSARRWSERHRMARKFRGASLLAAIPLAASDFWAYASGGFKGTSEFVQGMSTSAQVAVGAYLALLVVSAFTYVKRNKAIVGAADKSYAYDKQNEEAADAERRKEEAEADAAEEAEAGPIVAALEKEAAADEARAAEALEKAGVPGKLLHLPIRGEARPEPKTQEEADALGRLYAELDSKDTAIINLQAQMQVLAERLGLANAAREALDKKLLRQERAAASIEESEELRRALAAKAGEISQLGGEIKKLNAQVNSLEGDRDIIAKEKERMAREREGFERSNREKERQLTLAAELLAQRNKDLAELRAQAAAAAKSAKPEPVVAQAPAEPVAAKEAPAPVAEAVPADATPVGAAEPPVGPVATPEVPAAVPEPLRGSPVEGVLPETVTDMGSEEPDGYRPSGPAVSV